MRGRLKRLILLKGGGDLATGAAWRLARCGLPVIITELPEPLVVRRTVAFASAVFDGAVTVEGIAARRAAGIAAALALLETGTIPVLVDPDAACLPVIAPAVLLDGIMAKRNTGTRRQDAPLVVALGPGFTAGVDCHAVVETNRGHWLGRVYWDRPAQADTGTPGRVADYDAERVLRAPVAGRVEPLHDIGDSLEEGELIARVAGHEVRAPFPGVLRGLIHPAVQVWPGLKIGDLDPRTQREHCFTISDKSLAIGGGILEAVFTHWERRGDEQSTINNQQSTGNVSC